MRKQVVNTTAKGRCVILIENFKLLTKVIARLKKDRIPFSIEDVEAVTYHPIYKEKDLGPYMPPKFVKGKRTCAATVITYGQ